MENLEYRAPETSSCAPRYGSVIALLAVLIVVNIVLLGLAAADRSWGALQIMILIGPATNLAAIVVFLALIPVVWRVSGRASVGLYVVLAVCAPILAIAIDAGCIVMMGLHGC